MAELANWSQPVKLGDRSTYDRPVVAGSSVLCMAWRDTEQGNIRVSISKDNSKTWSTPKVLTDRASQNGPALCFVDNKFVMAWRGLEQDNIWISYSEDGLNWSIQQMLNDRATNVSPSLGGDGNLAIMCWKGFDQDNIWISTSINGIDWSPQQLLSDWFSKFSPCIAAAKGKYLMSWQGLNPTEPNESNILVSTSRDGQNWSSPLVLNDRTTTGCPSVSFIPTIKAWYMAWRGKKENDIWVSYSENGTTWTPKVEITNIQTNSDTSLWGSKSTLWMTWRGTNENTIWTSTLSLK